MTGRIVVTTRNQGSLVSARLTPELSEAFHQTRERLGISRTQLIQKALEVYLSVSVQNKEPTRSD